MKHSELKTILERQNRYHMIKLLRKYPDMSQETQKRALETIRNLSQPLDFDYVDAQRDRIRGMI